MGSDLGSFSGPLVDTFDRERFGRWIDTRLSEIDCHRATRAYIVGVLVDGLKDCWECESIVLAYASARESGRFEQFQRIGDWILWSGIIVPARLENHRTTYVTIGRMSYDACYRLLGRRWPLYEELADRLPDITVSARRPGLTVVQSDAVV